MFLTAKALVVCSALCFIQANGFSGRADRKSLADGCARAERHIGTQVDLYFFTYRSQKIAKYFIFGLKKVKSLYFIYIRLSFDYF